MRRLAMPILTILAVAFLAACGGGATPTPASSGVPEQSGTGSIPSVASAAAAACAVAPAGAAATVNATIVDFGYNPQPIQAKVGDVVAWKNTGSAPHSVTLDDGSCDTDTINAGSSGMLLFNAPGTYTYHCKIHPGQMKDFTVEVR